MSHGASDCRDDWNSDTQNPNCHHDGDNGADFYDSGKGGHKWMLDEWRIPTEDLSKIYAGMGYANETAEKIEKCTTIMFVGSILERYFSDMITFKYENHTAFLTEELDLWFHGGLSDMAN